MADQELSYLVSLFDDPDEVVSDVVKKKILERGEPVLNELKTMLANEKVKKKQKLISDKLFYFNGELKINQLKAFSQNGYLSLCEGSYLISSLLTVGLERDYFYNLVTPIVSDIMSELSEDKTGVENVKIFNHIFYNRYKFSVCDTFMTNENNGIVSTILSTRRGNPIAISVLYFLLAQSCDLSVFPMCFPGGFVPVYMEKGEVLFYINIFHKGEIFLEGKLHEFLDAQGLEVKDDQLEIRDERILLTIYLESLLFTYGNKEEYNVVHLIERALKCFGEERFITMEEDDEE